MIPFQTLAQRHLVYAYLVVALLHIAYATYLTFQWRTSRSYKGQG